MARIAIVTDSVSCLPRDLLREYGIKVVPVELHYRGRTYRDGEDVTPEQVYSWLAQGPELPTTSAPPPAAFLEAFRQFKDRSILCITVASRLSAVFASARLAKEASEELLEKKDIEVLDSGSACMAQGFVVLAAAREAARGRDFDEVVSTAKKLASRVHVLGMLDTLYYLVRGGRVPKVAAWVTELFQIKPILRIAGGEIGLVSRVRTRQKALERLVEIVRRQIDGKGGSLHLAVHHVSCPETAEELRAKLLEEFKPVELYVTPFSPVMGVHTGPGLIGLAFYQDDRALS